MRILMLAQNYPPIAGGEEQHVRNLSIELVRRGHEVAVACLQNEHHTEFFADEGVRVYPIGGMLQRIPLLFSTGRRFAPPFPDPETTRALRQIIARERPEIVHAHNWLVYSFLPLKASSGASLVLTLHDYSLACPQKRFMYHNEVVCDGPRLRKCLACASDYYGAPKGVTTTIAHRMMGHSERSKVDMFLPVSRAVADGNGLTGSTLPYQVIPNFVPDNVAERRTNGSPLMANLPTQEFILFVGDLSRDKGVRFLLDAVNEMEDCPPVVLIGRVGRETPTKLPKNVTLLPGWPHDAVMEAWHASALALAPSLFPDPCPTVAMEAMATGSPVIGSRIGGLVDIVADGETGLLVTPGDVVALRAAIKRLMGDHALRERMGQASKRRVAAFQVSAVVPQIERVYQNMRRMVSDGLEFHMMCSPDSSTLNAHRATHDMARSKDVSARDIYE